MINTAYIFILIDLTKKKDVKLLAWQHVRAKRLRIFDKAQVIAFCARHLHRQQFGECKLTFLFLVAWQLS